MKSYISRLLAELGRTDAFTHMLPYADRLAARRATHRG